MSVKSTTSYELLCDICHHVTLAWEGATVRELRRQAKAAGWRYIRAGYRDVPTAQDRCGRCVRAAS